MLLYISNWEVYELAKSVASEPKLGIKLKKDNKSTSLFSYFLFFFLIMTLTSPNTLEF